MAEKKKRKPIMERQTTKFVASIVQDLCELPLEKLSKKEFARLNRKRNQHRKK